MSAQELALHHCLECAYQAGLRDGRAEAAVAIAEIEEKHQQIAWWRTWTARQRQLQQPPDVRMAKAMCQIRNDMDFARDARAKRRGRSPMESAVVGDLVLGDPGDAA